MQTRHIFAQIQQNTQVSRYMLLLPDVYKCLHTPALSHLTASTLLLLHQIAGVDSITRSHLEKGKTKNITNQPYNNNNNIK